MTPAWAGTETGQFRSFAQCWLTVKTMMEPTVLRLPTPASIVREALEGGKIMTRAQLVKLIDRVGAAILLRKAVDVIRRTATRRCGSIMAPPATLDGPRTATSSNKPIARAER